MESLAENIPLLGRLVSPEGEQFKIFFTVEGDLSSFAREIERRRRLTHRNIYCRDPSREMKKAQRRIRGSTASDVEFLTNDRTNGEHERTDSSSDLSSFSLGIVS